MNPEIISSGDELRKKLGIEDSLKSKFDELFTEIKNGRLEITEIHLDELKKKLKNATNDKKESITRDYLMEKLYITNEAKNNIGNLQSNVEEKARKAKENAKKEAYKIVDGLSFGLLSSFGADFFLKEAIDERLMTKEELEEKKEKDLEGKGFMDKSLYSIKKAFSLFIGKKLLNHYKEEFPNLDSIDTDSLSNNLGKVAVVSAGLVGTAVSSGSSLIESLKEKVGKGEEKNKENKKEVKEKFTTEQKISGYGILGKMYLKKISPSSVLFKDHKNNYNSFIDGVIGFNKTYKQIKDITKTFLNNKKNTTLVEKVKNELGISHIELDNNELIGMLEVLAGNNSQFIIEENLGNIDKIINSPSFKKKFGDTFKHLEGKNVNTLKYEDVIFLLGYSLPIGVVGTVGMFLPDTENLGQFKKAIENEVNEKKEGFFSKKFLTIITNDKINEPSHLKDIEKIVNKEIEDEENNDIKKELKQDLDDFNHFKDFTITLLKLEKYDLGLNNFEKDFIDKLSIQDILSLFLLFDGKFSQDKLSGTSNIFMYLWISNIPQENTLRNKYIQELAIKSDEEGSNYLSEKEMIFLVPLLKQFGYKIILIEWLDNIGNIKASAQTVGIKLLKEQGIEFNKDKYEYIDYAILGILVGGNFMAGKLPLPLPLKFLVMAAISSGTLTMLVGILKERGTLKKMLIDETLPRYIRTSLEELEIEFENSN